MLVEALVYALSLPATPGPFRRHLGDAVGLWARGRRQWHSWRPHLERTRAAIAGAMPQTDGRGAVVVLGSGPLFDVPLPALASRFARVVLVDRAHLVGAQRQVGHTPAAELVWRDLAGPLGFLAGIERLDWVISVNLLSQLAHGAAEGDERRVVDAHLAALAALPCPATLVTDLDYEISGRHGAVIDRFDLLYGRALPPPDATWRWPVAPFGEEHPTEQRIHRVAAFRDWRLAAREQAGFPAAASFAMPSPADPVAQQDRAQDS